MSWQNQYRPRALSDLHLASVRQRMLKYLETGRLPQVLLFAGPKGTGKTSTARIIAGILNSAPNAASVEQIYFQKTKPKTKLSEPDLSDDQVAKIFSGQSFLVQEMDAASHRKIDDVRALQDQVWLPPTIGKMSVYILDEAHMFTTEAFNALLKLLEEPPEHAVFILATTELHKIPATITSRCTLIEFHKAGIDELVDAFTKTLKAQKIPVPDLALLQQIASAADGSFRDGLKLLEMAAIDGEITADSITKIIQTASSEQLNQLLDLIVNQKDEAALHLFFQNLRDQAADPQYFAKSWLNYLYHQLELNLVPTDQKPRISFKIAHFLLTQFSDLNQNNSPQLLPFLSLELKALDLVMKSKKTPSPSAVKTEPPKTAALNLPKPPTLVKKEVEMEAKIEEAAAIKKTLPKKAAAEAQSEVIAVSGANISEHWTDFLKKLTADFPTLASLLKLGRLKDEDDLAITVELTHSFHQDRLSQPQHLKSLTTTLQGLGLPPKKFVFLLISEKPSASRDSSVPFAATSSSFSSSAPTPANSTVSKSDPNSVSVVDEGALVLAALT